MPWPMPQSINQTSNVLYFLKRTDFEMRSNMKVPCDIIEENFKFYDNVIFPPRIYRGLEESDDINLLTLLDIVIEESSTCPGYPSSEMDESYELRIQKGTALLKSKSVWGALRGLDTFSQLIYLTTDQKLALNDSTWIVDFPRFAYRGVMIDTARHFIPVPILKKQIDGMSYNKFNVFHW